LPSELVLSRKSAEKSELVLLAQVFVAAILLTRMETILNTHTSSSFPSRLSGKTILHQPYREAFHPSTLLLQETLVI
jgi:hypothetical protein